MTSEKKTFRPLTSNDVCEIYKLLNEERLVSFPLTQDACNKVDSIVANITQPHYGTEIYPTAEEKAVAYFYFLIKDHPFTDGNKRTATLTFYVICRINKLRRDESIQLDALAVLIEKIKEDDHKMVISVITKMLFRVPKV